MDPQLKAAAARCVSLQWREASYTSPAGDIDRVYTVCNAVVARDTDHWLVMPYLVADTANRIYIQVRFIVRRCAGFADSSSRHRCKVCVEKAPLCRGRTSRMYRCLSAEVTVIWQNRNVYDNKKASIR